MLWFLLSPLLEGGHEVRCSLMWVYIVGSNLSLNFQLRSITAPISLFSVEKHNSTPGNDPIRSVLCPGLGTAVGRMPAERCAYQVTTQIVFFFNCIKVLKGIIVGMESRKWSAQWKPPILVRRPHCCQYQFTAFYYTHPPPKLCLWGGGILFSRCPSVYPSTPPSMHPCICPWHFGFSLIPWKGNDRNSSNFADTLISIRCTFIIENYRPRANSVIALCNS